MKEILPNIHLLKLGAVNAYLVDHGALTLIDAGNPDSEDKIIAYIRKIGKGPKDVANIIVTHLHTDHSGSVAAMVEKTGANVFMHPVDAALVKTGQSFRDDVAVTPGIFNRFLFNFVIKRAPRVIPPFDVTTYLEDNAWLDIGKGFRVFHVPGHAQGQIALLYEKTLFAADTAGNLFGLALAPFYENLEQGKRDVAKLASLNFESAVFGHGKPILNGASEMFAKKFLAQSNSGHTLSRTDRSGV